MNQPVLFEGYEPPRDPRLLHFRITPDPGVIEVNIHPASSWDESAEQTTFLYDAARESRLATENSCSTAATPAPAAATTSRSAARPPADSPWLRRPDLLRSLFSLLAQPSVAILSFQRSFHRPDFAGAAHRRGAQRFGARNRSGVSRAGTARDSQPARLPALADRPAAAQSARSTSPATPTAPSSASTNSTRRTAPPGVWDCSRCAPSRCRRTRA